MTIAAALDQPDTDTGHRACVVGRFIAGLEAADRTAVTAHLARPRSAARVWRVLSDAGMSASLSAVRTHNRRECVCPTDARSAA